MKVRARQIAINDGRLAVVDSKGRVWERHTDMPVGEWGSVTLPNEPTIRQRRKLYKKR